MGKLVKKVGRFLCSMQCAILLLLILVAACTAGSLIPQKEVLSFYTGSYSEQLAGAILLFGLDDVFHCGWFIVLTLALCLNLILCNVRHFPKLIRRMKTGYTLEKCLAKWNGEALAVVADPEDVFQKLGFHNVQEQKTSGLSETGCRTEKSEEKSEERLEERSEAGSRSEKISEKIFRYGCRNRAGIWGSWLCHLGMLVIIAGFGFGQMMKTEYTVYGVSGQTKPVGDTGYELTIDDFQILLREDDTVEQYTAELTVSDPESGKEESGTTSVNSPLSMFGMKFYQNSTGWASGVTVWRGDEIIQEELLCAGEYLNTADKEELILMLRAFYPDYMEDTLGNAMTASSALNNPAYLYALYYQDQVLGMNVIRDGEKITVDEYTYEFHDPQPYTLIQVKRDPFTWLAAVGGLMVLAALILAFYIRPEELWAMKQEDGTWMIAGMSRKGGAMYEDRIREVCADLGNPVQEN